jgi:pyridinium-3,5-biscarboxylic acid mononucleotide synthase
VTPTDSLHQLLSAVSSGTLSPEDALEQIKYLATYESVEDFAKIDHHRQVRTGFPEVIWGIGKTPEQIADIFRAMIPHQSCVMATRIEPAVYDRLQVQLPELRYYAQAKICALQQKDALIPQHPGRVGIISAGTADLPIAEEAAVTATLCGFSVHRLWDVGVAGIHRLLQNQKAIAQADVLIVVAGMEGALASVVAGLADCPVVAVPTSIGYGASFNGLAPLLTMLNSCAPGIGVVNIDNGFGAAILAGQILRTAARVKVASVSS